MASTVSADAASIHAEPPDGSPVPVTQGTAQADTGGEGTPEAAQDVGAFPFSVRLRLLRNQLTETERRAGDYFAGDPGAMYRSITEVVEDSGLGYGSIIRFCRKMGCAGFQEFKLLLAQEHGRRATGGGPADSGSPDLVSRCLERLMGDLRGTSIVLSREQLAVTAQAIASASRVLIGAVASSAPLAASLDWKLSRIGLVCGHEREGYVLAVRAALLRPGDVLVAISSSGATKDILQAGHVAKERGATLVAITSFSRSPLAQIADHCLHAVADRDPISAEVPSTIATEFVIELLFEHVRLLVPDREQVITRTFRAIADRKL